MNSHSLRPVPQPAPSLAEHAAAVSAGLRNADAFIMTHYADLPLAAAGDPLSYTAVLGGVRARLAEIDSIARILGTAAAWNDKGTAYAASREFGGGIRYRAVAYVNRPVSVPVLSGRAS